MSLALHQLKLPSPQVCLQQVASGVWDSSLEPLARGRSRDARKSTLCTPPDTKTLNQGTQGLRKDIITSFELLAPFTSNFLRLYF